MSDSFKIYNLQGEEVTLDKNKQYVRTQYGQIVEIAPGTELDPRSLQLVASQADLRISDVNFTNLLKVDNKLTLTKDQLISRKRKTFTYQTLELEADEFETFEIPVGCSCLVTRLEVDDLCTLEIFSDSVLSDSTPYTFISTEDHMIDDGRTLMTDNTTTVSKRVFTLVNRDQPVKNVVYGRITNSQSALPLKVNLIIEYISLETIDVTRNLTITTSHNSQKKSNGEMFKVSAVLATPARFVMGPNGQSILPNIEETYQANYDYLDQKSPTKYWPVDENGGYWAPSETDSGSEVDAQYLNTFTWPQTPQDGDYSLYLRLDSIPLSVVLPTTIVNVSISLGTDAPVVIPIEVNNVSENLGKILDTCIKFTLDGGSFVISPQVKTTDISRDSVGVD